MKIHGIFKTIREKYILPEPTAWERQGCCDTHMCTRWIPPTALPLYPSLPSCWHLDVQAPRDAALIWLLVQTTMHTHTHRAGQDSPSRIADSSLLSFLETHRCPHTQRQPLETHSPSHSQATSPARPSEWRVRKEFKKNIIQTALNRHRASPDKHTVKQTIYTWLAIFIPLPLYFPTADPPEFPNCLPFPAFGCSLKHFILNSVQSWSVILLYSIISPMPLGSNAPQCARWSGELVLLTILIDYLEDAQARCWFFGSP